MSKKSVIPDEIMDLLMYYQEMMIKHSDINYKEISNGHATKFVLGRLMRVPRELQTRTINGFIKVNILKRKTQQILEIVNPKLS